MHQGAEHQRRIGHPARDHYVSAFIQRSCDRSSSEIDVRGHDAGKIGEHRTLRLARSQFLGREDVGQIVALDHGNSGIGKSCCARQCCKPCPCGARVRAAEIADNSYAVGETPAERRRQHAVERGAVAAGRITPLASWQSASVRSASVSKIKNPPPPQPASSAMIGNAASARSPAKPAAQPTRTSPCIEYAHYAPTVRAGDGKWSCDYVLRVSGTLPPLSASLVITCLCSQMFISAEPFSAPV